MGGDGSKSRSPVDGTVLTTKGADDGCSGEQFGGSIDDDGCAVTYRRNYASEGPSQGWLFCGGESWMRGGFDSALSIPARKKTWGKELLAAG